MFDALLIQKNNLMSLSSDTENFPFWYTNVYIFIARKNNSLQINENLIIFSFAFGGKKKERKKELQKG